jgi:hypothetical protein
MAIQALTSTPLTPMQRQMLLSLKRNRMVSLPDLADELTVNTHGAAAVIGSISTRFRKVGWPCDANAGDRWMFRYEMGNSQRPWTYWLHPVLDDALDQIVL